MFEILATFSSTLDEKISGGISKDFHVLFVTIRHKISPNALKTIVSTWALGVCIMDHNCLLKSVVSENLRIGTHLRFRI